MRIKNVWRLGPKNNYVFPYKAQTPPMAFGVLSVTIGTKIA